MDGLLIVDKPEGWTSHDVVARARRVLREKRVGHTGTLDPFATGVLVLLVGRATRLAQFLAGAEKEYEATIRLGFSTDTGDLTGARRESPGLGEAALDCSAVSLERLEAALAPLRGEIEQVPPMYSAKKVGGKKLYELARRGEEVERRAARVRVSEFEIVAGGGGSFIKPNADGTCDVRARVVCSAGTYVRALAESAGENLGTGAHLAALRRTRAGDFGAGRALTLEGLEGLVGAGGEFLLPLEAALPHLPAAHLTAEDARRVMHGAAVPARHAAAWEEGAHVALYGGGGALVAVAAYDASAGLLRPRVMLAAEK
ncbi:MAG TPA: tRNA pseudouridine(55) synthase TruB [Pyrinomonadaceae bacterium]|jgi:tRNA pseudouridine55 synthase